MIILLGSCSRDENKKNYGKYEFDKVIYVWAASPCTRDYLKEKYAGTKYIIKKDKFEVINSQNEVETEIEIENPTYKKEEMKGDLVQRFIDALDYEVSISRYKEKYQYTVYNKYEIPIYYIYSMDDELWITDISKNTIKHILKLK